MKMHYAERLGREGEPYIAERGVFLSVEEFIPFRKKGWSGTKEFDEAADKIIKFENKSDEVLEYLAPMHTMKDEREELCRRRAAQNCI
jgi:hypothetical protein